MRGNSVRRYAFTLIELLVVIAIIGVLIGLLLPAVQKVRSAATRVKCQNNMKQLGVALLNYESAYQQFPPAGRSYNFGATTVSARDSPGINLHGLVLLLPFIEQDALYREWDPKSASSFAYGTNGSATWPVLGGAPSAANVAMAQTLVPAYICPADTGPNKTAGSIYYGITASAGGYKTSYDFSANEAGGVDANYWKWIKQASPGGVYMFGENSTTRIADVIDGTSNTIAMGETTFSVHNGMGWNNWAYRCWVSAGIDPAVTTINNWTFIGVTYPVGTAGSWAQLASMHPGGANVVLADGSVHFLAETTPTSVLAHLSTISGSEVEAVP